MGFDSLRQYQSYTHRNSGDGKDSLAVEDYFRTIRRVERFQKPYPQPQADWNISRRHQYALGHMSLAIFCAFRFRGQLEIPDALQAACMGLLRAAELFDPSLGASFGTYAMY
jgi:DNA-directed RNA polymerase sigma subunit (sigma70/sigma32)